MRSVCRLIAGDQHGSIFLPSLALVVVMTLLGIALLKLATIDYALSSQETSWNQLLYCANSALGRTMIDYSPVGPGRMVQIYNAVQNAPGSTITFPSETLTIRNDVPGYTCATSVTFTDDTVNARRLLQATATAPNGTQRSVRIQLLNLSWQTWTANSTDLNQSGGPYWDKVSLDGSNKNVGYYLTNSGNFSGCTGSTCGPGVPLSFWGQRYNQATDPGSVQPDYSTCPGGACGMPSSDIFLKGKGGTVTFVQKVTSFTDDNFGWFESDATGSLPTNGCPSDSKCHALIAESSGTGATATFTTPVGKPYYGFYLTNARGTFYTLAGLARTAEMPGGLWAGKGYTGNQLTPAPNDCPTCNPGPAYPGCVGCTDPGCAASCSLPTVPYQHFTIFQKSAGEYWIGIEDLWNLGHGNKCLCPAGQVCPPSAYVPTDGPRTSCIPRTNVDEDYQDMIIKFVPPAGDLIDNPNTDFRRWKDWQECVGAAAPSC